MSDDRERIIKTGRTRIREKLQEAVELTKTLHDEACDCGIPMTDEEAIATFPFALGTGSNDGFGFFQMAIDQAMRRGLGN